MGRVVRPLEENRDRLGGISFDGPTEGREGFIIRADFSAFLDAKNGQSYFLLVENEQ